MTMTRNQLRAARMLLSLSQEELAALSEVGVATIRRYETGLSVNASSVELLQTAVETAGAVLLSGEQVSGRQIGEGVALASKLPRETVRRLGRTSQAGSAGKPGRPRKVGPEPSVGKSTRKASGKAAERVEGST